MPFHYFLFPPHCSDLTLPPSGCGNTSSTYWWSHRESKIWYLIHAGTYQGNAVLSVNGILSQLDFCQLTVAQMVYSNDKISYLHALQLVKLSSQGSLFSGPVVFRICKGYSESTLPWAANKTSNEGEKKNMYILKLLLNIVTAGIEASVVSGNKFLYTYAKEVCCLWIKTCFDTFHQLLITAEALWSQPVLLVGKQVVVAWSAIRAGRKVVKQLPAEILQ
jgi:hypothetical protein